MTSFIFFIPVTIIFLTHLAIVRTIWRMRVISLELSKHKLKNKVNTKLNKPNNTFNSKQIHCIHLKCLKSYKNSNEKHFKNLNNIKYEFNPYSFQSLNQTKLFYIDHSSTSQKIDYKSNNHSMEKLNTLNRSIYIKNPNNKFKRTKTLSSAKIKSIKLTFFIVTGKFNL